MTAAANSRVLSDMSSALPGALAADIADDALATDDVADDALAADVADDALAMAGSDSRHISRSKSGAVAR